MMIAVPASAQTFGSAVTDNSVGPFGRDALFDPFVFGAVAQTFVTPAGSPVLQSFTFYLGDFIGGADLRVQASIFAFNTNRLVGPALYTSTVRNGSTDESGFTPFLFSGVNLLLTPATTYAFLLRPTAATPDGSSNLVATSQTNTFTLGSLFTSTATSDAALAANGAFTQSTANTFGADAALTATFGPATTTVPEPSTVLLVATGLGVVGMLARRKAKNAA